MTEKSPATGLTPIKSAEQMEHEAQILRMALRSVREVDPTSVASFMVKFANTEKPSPRKIATDLGMKWVAVRRAIYSSPDLEDFWESLIHAKVDELLMEIPNIMDDEEVGSMTDRKSKASMIMQWAKMMNPMMYSDKGGDTTINLSMGETIDKARIRVVKMKQQLALAIDTTDSSQQVNL